MLLRTARLELATSAWKADHLPTNNMLAKRRRFFIFQPQVPLRLPCYDFIIVKRSTFISNFQCVHDILVITIDNIYSKVDDLTSDKPNFRDVTGGVYKAQVHIHRSILIYDY